MRGLTGCLSFDKGSFQGLNDGISKDSRVHAFLITSGNMHIGSIIQQKLKEQGKTVVWLATELGCHRTNVYNLFDKYSIDTQLLSRLCIIMHYNFFSLYEENINTRLAEENKEKSKQMSR